jgi:polyhydroxyalkanoate synthase
VLAGRRRKAGGQRHLADHLIDFTDTGMLDVFIDEAFVKFREMQLGQGGLMPGPGPGVHLQLPAAQRPGVELRGGQLPQGRNAAAVRPALLEQRLHQPAGPLVRLVPAQHLPGKQPGQARQVHRGGQKIDLGKVDMPVYIYGSREDHIVPIGGAYASVNHLPGKKRFVMGASGHIAGVINPPAKKKRSHWTATSCPRPMTTGSPAPRSTPAAGGPTGPPGSRATPASKLLPPSLRQGQVQGHRARPRKLCQGQGLTPVIPGLTRDPQ